MVGGSHCEILQGREELCPLFHHQDPETISACKRQHQKPLDGHLQTEGLWLVGSHVCLLRRGMKATRHSPMLGWAGFVT